LGAWLQIILAEVRTNATSATTGISQWYAWAAVDSPNNEERRLYAEYETATNFYSWTVRELAKNRGMLPHDQYDRLLNLVGNARLECELARAALQTFRDGN
jgi:hypothetical protein